MIKYSIGRLDKVTLVEGSPGKMNETLEALHEETYRPFDAEELPLGVPPFGQTAGTVVGPQAPFVL